MKKRKRIEKIIATVVGVMAILVGSVTIIFASNGIESTDALHTSVNPTMAIAAAVVALLVGVLVFTHRNFIKK